MDLCKNFRILLDSECSSTIKNGKDSKKLSLEEDAPMQWNTHAIKISTNLKVKVDFTYPYLARRMSWHGYVMLINLLRVGTIWYYDGIYEQN